MTLAKLEEEMNFEVSPNNINIIKAIKTCMKQILGKDVDSNTKVLVPHLNYFTKLNKILNDVSAEDISNYLIFNKILEFAQYTTQQMRNLKQQFTASIKGTVTVKPRWVVNRDAKVSKLPDLAQTLIKCVKV